MTVRARILLIVIAGAILMWSGYLKTSRAHDLPQGQIKIAAAPAGADITVDGHKTKAGEHDIDIGPHKIKIAMEGFSSYESTVDVTQSEQTYVGAVLDSDSQDTQNWYDDNPDDQKIAEGINDHLSDSQSENITTEYPIFDRLPAVFGNGQGGLTKIESEAALDGADKPSIGIYATNPQQRQAALDWISSRGYTLSDIDVVFYGANIPLESRLPR